jgi:phage terminase Nu1 subunit (DNA packaging protein)
MSGEGRVDRNLLVRSLARNTRLTQADAEQVASRIEERLGELRARAEEAKQQATRAALRAAEVTGQVMLILSVLMLLGLGTAVAGAVASVRRERREHVVLPRAQTSARSVG